MSTQEIKIAVLQCALHDDIDSNFTKIRHAAEVARQQGCQLLVLPELHQGSYFCQTEDRVQFERAETIPGPSSKKLAELAQDNKLVIIASLFEKRMQGVFHNTAVVFDKDGRMVGYYRKMHIPDDPGYYEKFYFTPGDSNGFKPITTSIGILGVLVCWDQWFPEAARLMALAGAEILIYPTAIGWDARDSKDEQLRQLDAWKTVQRGHAVANHLPVVCCNRNGFEGHPECSDTGISFWGNSFICGPQGELLAAHDQKTSGLLLADWRKQNTESLRKIWPFFRDRRIDAYHALLNRCIENSEHNSQH